MWLFQNPTPDSPVLPDLRTPIPVNDSKLPGTATFEKTVSEKKGAGGLLRDITSGYGFHVTGTAADGKFIPAATVDRSGKPAGQEIPTPKFSITDDAKIIAMFDLVPCARPDSYERPGFEGFYTPLKESDGTCALFYAGGKHKSGLVIPPQTFHHGVWDLERNTAPTSATVAKDPPKDLPKDPPKDLKLPPPKEVVTEPAKKDEPVKKDDWNDAAAKAAAAAMGKDNGISGSGDRPGFAAVFYKNGAVTNFHKNFPGGDPTTVIPYDKLAPDLRKLQPFTLKTSDEPTAVSFRATVSTGAMVVKASDKVVYLFRTESKLDGFGVVLLEGSEASLPPIVRQAYASAVDLGKDNRLATNRWMLMDRETKLYAMVRPNGQVIICKAGSNEAEMFDPLQAVLLNANQTKAQEAKKETSWATLKDLYAEKGGPKFRKVVWDSRGYWKYTVTGVPTIGPERDEPAVPKE